MSGRRVMLSLLALLVTVSVTQAQKKTSLEDLSWLTGCWEGRQGDAILEEIWSKPGGGSMLGLGRTVKKNRTASFEFMQFREEKVWFFCPNRRAALVFLFRSRILLGES